jgi:hypothetical protein
MAQVLRERARRPLLAQLRTTNVDGNRIIDIETTTRKLKDSHERSRFAVRF